MKPFGRDKSAFERMKEKSLKITEDIGTKEEYIRIKPTADWLEERHSIQLFKYIASGSTGSVFAGKQINTKEKIFYSVKVCFKKDFEQLTGFDREFEIGEFNKSTMELAMCTLHEILGELEAKDVRRYFYQLLKGLQYMHDVARIAHLDIKPINILITYDNKAKLCDFSLSEYLHDPLFQFHPNLRSIPVGTFDFLGPEQFFSDRVPCELPTADIYQFGVTLFIAYTKEYPFESFVDTEEEIESHFYSQMRHNQFKKKLIARDLEFRNLIYYMMNPIPDLRMTAKELLNHDWFKPEAIKEAKNETSKNISLMEGLGNYLVEDNDFIFLF